MKNIEVVAAAIIDKTTVFAAARGYGEFKGMWEFPGGKVETNESHEDAIKREIREEFTCEIDVIAPISTVIHDYTKFTLTMHLYECTVVSGTLIPQEHIASRFLTVDELQNVHWLPADEKLLPRIRTLLQSK